jgi:hypothetical protein
LIHGTDAQVANLRGHEVNVKRVYRLYAEEGLSAQRGAIIASAYLGLDVILVVTNLLLSLRGSSGKVSSNIALRFIWFGVFAYPPPCSSNLMTMESLVIRRLEQVYERLALSRDKKAIHDLARQGQDVSRPQDILKEPYVLEFLGLEGRHTYSESDLEAAIVEHVQHFLLELGKEFQQRMQPSIIAACQFLDKRFSKVRSIEGSPVSA